MSAAATPITDASEIDRAKPSDDLEAHLGQIQNFVKQFQPKGALEEQLVKNLAGFAWRIDRLPALDAEILTRTSVDNPASLRAFFKITALNEHLNRQFDKTMRTLRDIQAARREEEEKDMEAAVALWELHHQEGTPFLPSETGFEFSAEQIELHVHQSNRRAQAQEAAKKRICDQVLSAYQ